MPTYYAEALLGEFSEWAYCEESTPGKKGKWRKEVFNVDESTPLDVEIGTGNGYHFAHYADTHPKRMFVGFEIKYKPLIQSIRRALLNGSKNARICRYTADVIQNVFKKDEIDNVIIHHPDPWPKKRDWKRRLIQDDFLKTLFELQKSGSIVEFKTDDRPYFDWALERFKRSPYELTGLSYDLHNSEFADQNYVTSFERIFLSKGQPIYYATLKKD